MLGYSIWIEGVGVVHLLYLVVERTLLTSSEDAMLDLPLLLVALVPTPDVPQDLITFAAPQWHAEKHCE